MLFSRLLWSGAALLLVVLSSLFSLSFWVVLLLSSSLPAASCPPQFGWWCFSLLLPYMYNTHPKFQFTEEMNIKRRRREAVPPKWMGGKAAPPKGENNI